MDIIFVMQTMILTPTSESNFKNLKVALDSSNAVLIQGDIGCGKSFLANTLADEYRAKDTLIQVNVDDSFDSKDLLGKFSATDTPGAFEWVPGPLTSAVENGFWILLEDIDLASFDVFSVLLSLLEESTLFLPEKNLRISSHPSFKIIATQQLRAVGDALITRKSNSIPFAELWGTVVIENLPPDEVCEVATTLYCVPTNIVRALATLVSPRTNVSLVSLRCLLKWCKRVSKRLPARGSVEGFLSSTVRELMFREAFDCILAGYPEGNELNAAMEVLADAVGISLNVAVSLVKESRPEMTLAREYVTVGRVTLPLFSSTTPERESRIAFAATKHAMSLLERIAAAVDAQENVLLAGETGVGKTFIVQYLAGQLGQKLIVHNLNQQTDTSDFMGGWKPLDVGVAVRNAYHKFVELFSHTFNASRNVRFLDALQAAVRKCSWVAVVKQILKGFNTFKLKNTRQSFPEDVLNEWSLLEKTAVELLETLEKAKTTFAFHFEEGSLVKAWREGSWILLDEVNLATTEVLERISSVMGDVNTLFLTDKGNCEPIARHKNFHVFANMNPPTDVGKKDLPPSLRSKFTEFYVNEPFDRYDISTIVNEYIGHLAPDCKTEEITSFFLECVGKAKSTLCSLDGESRPPSFSLRTLTRALAYVRKATSQYGFALALFDGLMLGFATSLQRQFHNVVEQLIIRNVFFGNQPPHATLPHCPSEGNYIAYEHIWLSIGSEEPIKDEAFILTSSVRGHLLNVARAVFADRPVLLEGPTSSGKSSMVKYLAELTGHKCVRINNHESTEIQEYVGHYVSDERGKLRFVDGILVDAVRNGYWVVLDELNLAPTDVLEALNRLLDDNRELFVADTQETIKPHPDLRIFATQNPAGIYGGRKLLSRAFRNRFLEMTVDDIPTSELCTILCQRYSLCTSFAEKMVDIMVALQLRRQSSQVFAGRHGFITPRDLFRWAERQPGTYQEMAEHGFLLLAERCRKAEERQIVKDIIESVTKTELNEDLIYSPQHWPYVAEFYSLMENGAVDEFGIVWTESMRRLFTVTGICLHHKEPVLLVGETGSSKTTVCQLWAALLNRPLSIVNCHQHSEAADFLGNLRPAPPNQRSRAIFEWRNGPLVECMLQGNMFLLDEISLAEDSVLERLNSVLEPSRVITLAEKSTADVIYAHENFRVFATMNPGGDFGKKELSPALRNRFTEIYVRPTTDEAEVTMILSTRLLPSLEPWAKRMATLLCNIAHATTSTGAPQHISIRDIIAWVSFMNAANTHCDDRVAFMHGLDAVILDGMGIGTGQLEIGSRQLREICLEKAKELSGIDESCLQIPFWELFDALKEPQLPPEMERRFFFGAPSTRQNLSKLIRASIMRNAILLEGSPGVGKTSIVEALGCAFGKRVVRINLSDQTDIMDLFGTYLPCPSSGEADEPQFAWSDGVLLQALKAGWWVILDELNLASQAVLEGLNALLDHRSAVFIPELGEEFHAADDFRVFACQNPLLEGGGRKGLPRSFLNRFTKVRIEPFDVEDLLCIAFAVCPDIDRSVLENMVQFVGELQRDVMVYRAYGTRGSPWEFNLRDVLRWAKLMEAYQKLDKPCEFIQTLFIHRMRTDVDKTQVHRLARRYFGDTVDETRANQESDFLIANEAVCFGGSFLAHRMPVPVAPDVPVPLLLLPSKADVIRSILICAEQNQFCLLVGPSGAGKTFCIRTAASLVGARLVTFSMNATCDTVDLLGGFDQVEGKQGQFAWRDSLILEAMLLGHWLVLDNVNYCNASVLDRLNPLVEPNGMLSVNEQGLVEGRVRTVQPHPNFRLFATLDPKYGEISRAMRNRAVEVYIDPICIPSFESIAIAGAVSPCKMVKVLDRLGNYHREFVIGGFHADSALPMSSQLSDALAAGAPNTFTLIKTAEMLPMDATLSDMKAALLHKYIRNRCGHWLVNKPVVLEALDHMMSEDLEHSARCYPLVTDLLSAMSLTEGAEETDVESALIRIRVHRSGLGLKTLVFLSNTSLIQHSLRDVLLFFLLEQCSDTVASDMLTSARWKFLSSILSTLPAEDEMREALLLLSPHYGQISPTSLESLWCRSMHKLGPCAAWCKSIGGSYILVSDSPVLNSAFQEVFRLTLEATSGILIPRLLQCICRYLFPLLQLLFVSNPPFQLTADNFVLLVTHVALIRSVAKKQTVFEAGALLEAIDQFLASLRRYLDLPYPLLTSKSAVQRSVIRPHITSLDERSAFAAWNAAATAATPSPIETLLKSLWHTAIFRAEFALVQRVQQARWASSAWSAKFLQRDIRQFIDLYCTRLHALSELEVTLWREVLSLRLQEGGDEQALAALVPLLTSHFIARHGLASGCHSLHGAWTKAAYETLKYAAGVSVISMRAKLNEHTEVMTELLRFCNVLPVVDANPFEQWERNSLDGLLSLLIVCAPHLFRTEMGIDALRSKSSTQALELLEVVRAGMQGCCADPLLNAARPLLQVLANDQGDTPEDSLRRVALVGALKCRFLLPSSPIDPMHKWLVKKEVARVELGRLTCMEKAFAWSEEISMRSESHQRRLVHDLLTAEEALLLKATGKSVARPDPSGAKFARLVSVLHQMCNTAFSDDRLAVVLYEKRQEAYTARLTWSELLYRQMTEMLENYGGYEDVTLTMAEPALLSALAAHVSCHLQPSARASNKALFSMSEAVRMMHFPHIAVSSVTLPSLATHALEHRLAYLDSCLMLVQGTPARILKREFVEHLFDAYRELYRTVEELEAKERREEEIAVLYAEKAITIEGDDEKHLRALKKLFPSYEEDFIRMRDAVEDIHETAAEATDCLEPSISSQCFAVERAGRHARLMLSGSQGARYVRHLIEVHHYFFERLLALQDNSVFDGEKALHAFAQRFDILSSELHRFGFNGISETGMILPAAEEQLLLGGFAARAVLVTRELLPAEVSLEEKRASGFNIFTDPAPSEIRAFSASLQDLLQAVENLRTTYPDTPSLLRCSRIANGIGALPALTTPLMKIMTGCEVLLRECYEWERNASRDTSILLHMTKLSSFVLRWRRLELHCWSQVFKAKREEWELKAGMQWFSLYDLVNGGDTLTGEALSERCLLLFRHCMDFMWGAQYGDFHVRLRLLRAFALHLVASSSSSSSLLIFASASPLANVAMHLVDFFSQFLPLVSEKLRAALLPLEEDMEAFTRIMRWEDSTYYAVRATAEKSHLEMGRALAELDKILRTPVLGVIAGEEQRCEEDAAMGFVLPSEELKGRAKPKLHRFSSDGNNRINNGQPTTGSKRTRSGKQIPKEAMTRKQDDAVVAGGCVGQGVQFLTDSAEEIIERVKSLQAQGVPQSQKLRALKILFQTMEESGVPHTHEEQVSPWEELFASTNALLTCRSVHGHLAVSQQVEEAAAEHYRFARWIQRMREAERHPHKDLSGAQVKRGTGTVESLFALAVEETELIGTLYEVLHQVTLVRGGVATCEEFAVPGGGELLHTSLEVCVQLQCFLHHTRWLTQEQVFGLDSAVNTIDELSRGTEELWKLCLASEAQRRTDVCVTDAILGQHTTLHMQLRGVCARLCNTGVGCVDAAASAVCVSLNRALSVCTGVTEATAVNTKRTRTENGLAWHQKVQQLLNELEMVYKEDDVDSSSPGLLDAGDDTAHGGDAGAAAVYHRYATALRELKRNSQSITLSLQALLCDPVKQRRISSGLRQELLVRLDTNLGRIATLLQEAAVVLRAQSHLGLVLSRLFCILLKKGFCKPEEQDEEENDDGDGGDGEQKDGTGMDDGQGEKDVTDQIDNEDQLMNMKDKEEQEQEEQERNGDEEDKAADVETDFKGNKEQREAEDDEDEDEDDDASMKEMGSVDGEEAQERKRMKKDKHDGNDMNSDDGGDAEEVPEDAFGNEEAGDEDDGDASNEETGNFENREEALQEAERKLNEGEHELVADAEGIADTDEDTDGDDDGHSSRSSSSCGDNDDERSRSGSHPGDASKDPQGAEEDEGEDAAHEERLSGGDDDGSEWGEDEESAASCTSEGDRADENVFHGGLQDEHAGEEATERMNNAEDKEKREKQRPQDAAGVEQEQQPDDDQQPDDAGRNWQRQEKNDPSRQRDNTERSASSRNPYRAIKEALQRHERQVQQLNLDRNVNVKKQKSSEQRHQKQEEERDVNDDDAIDEFEFDEEGDREGMAATDEKPMPVTDAERDLPEMQEAESDGADSECEAPDDTSRRRRKSALDTTLKEESDEDEEEDAGSAEEDPDKSRGKRRVKVTAKKAAEDDQMDEEVEEEDGLDQQQDTLDVGEKMSRGRKLWQEQVAAVQGLSHHLCEQLRLILAPTLADKLQGDYKTGKRLNMKRIIPYIASQFKKDRIWLRRTKPNRRNYQILVALDDSFSMHCNNAGVMSCRAVALLAEALRQLEVGELGIACFGKETRIVHELQEPFMGDSGPRAFSEVTFAQKSTSLKLLLETSLDYLDSARERIHGQTRSTSQQLQQMMFIISDGQITEDRQELRRLLLRAEENRQVVVFVLLDVKATVSPTTATAAAAAEGCAAQTGAERSSLAPLAAKDLARLTPAERMRRLKAEREARLHRVQSSSILDMQLVEFKGGKVVRRSYMEEFPFPYYLIVRELETLPGAIADAMRQWFELLNVQH
ncbi:MDN1, midasin-like protein [Trypanosoma rangeli]|uniref:Midasin n=1 Tax=Trypanosoma rangeli TaxID=5698 RepID=A0A3R7NK86_TRYRA|nr:MDN1, midasin-like protein [Trypanosoma rangeli]RNF03864.1 MDN1, midasin-like protein [Trypanosoma rangeli]|eukprot:RNF03864.1 MDN1, midasin-like protein [Trypanosoma rangeli]